MSAQRADMPVADRMIAGSTAAAQWTQIHAVSPQVVATMQRYLMRLAAFQAPASVDVAVPSLRQFAQWMLSAGLHSVAAVRRDDIEVFKVWLANKPHPCGGTISAETHRQRLRMVRSFFERIIEWDWDGPQPGHRRRHTEEARAATEVPRRRAGGPVHGRRPGQHRSAGPARGGTAGPHRHAGR